MSKRHRHRRHRGDGQPAAPRCDVCASPVPDQAHLCDPCGRHLHATLERVPDLVDELTVAFTRQARLSSGNAGGGPSADTPLPYHQGAGDAIHELHNSLVGWVRVLLDHAPRSMPWPVDSPAAVAVWLAARVEWLRHHPAGSEAHADITAVVDRIEQVIDRPADRWYAGPCDRCAAGLYAHPDAARVRCRCGAGYDVTERRAWLLAAAEKTLAHASLISQALTRLGEPITPERIWQWRRRRRLTTRGNDPRGRPLYLVGDVMDLMAEDVARRAKRADAGG